MKILKLRLENFEAVKYCMNASELELDFTKMENKICLFIGPNGSGKTTVLSLLNPFATLGNLDVRDGYNLIIPGKNGKKEIWIQDGKHLYAIQHFYTANKESHSTKSYIQRDEEELNPNGNVTSFKEILHTELGLELDYMNLVRLGPNVRSIIDLTATERKNYMGKLLDDVGAYLKCYKHLSTNLKVLKEMLSHTVNNLHRCQYQTKEEYEKELKSLSKKLASSNYEIIDIEKRISSLETVMRELGTASEIKADLEDSGKLLKKLGKVYERISGEKRSASEYRAMYEEDKERKMSKESLLKVEEILLEQKLTSRDSLEERVRRMETRLSQEERVEDEIHHLKELRSNLKKMIQEREEMVGAFATTMTLEEFEPFYSHVKFQELQLRKIMEYGDGPVRQVIVLIREKKNVDHFVNTGLLENQGSENEREILLERLKRIVGTPVCETASCVGYKMYQMIQNLLTDRNVPDEVRKDSQFYQDVDMVYKGLTPLIESFRPFAKTIEKFPEEIKKQFTLSHIFDRIEKGKPLYHEKSMDRFYTLLKEQADLTRLYKEKDDVELQLAKWESMDQSALLREEYDCAVIDLRKVKEEIQNSKETIRSLKRELEEIEYDLEFHSDALETTEHYEELKEHYEEISNKYQKYHDASDEVRRLSASLASAKSLYETQGKYLGSLQADYQSFLQMTADLEKFHKHYDNMELLRRAVSTKEGIPTLIVDHYLEDVEGITNELLDIVYHGKLILANFDISADKFNIPVYNRGKLLADVKQVSQGERSLITIALSFALVAKSLGEYNIMVLDEVDGPLDEQNRRFIIPLLENQMDRIGAEQIVLISHNDTFSSYPVDIVDFSDPESHIENRKKYCNANFIPIELKG